MLEEEDRQLPVHYVAGASRIDSIHVALSPESIPRYRR